RCGFYRRIPAFNVVGGIGLGDPQLLSLLQSIFEAEALLHLAENYIGSGVQNAMKALQVNGGELLEQGEDGDSVQDCGFEQESFALFHGKIAEFAVGMDDGTFVGGDGVRSVLECRADVVDGWLAVPGI